METPTSYLSYRNCHWLRALDTWYDIDYGNGIFAMVGGSASPSINDNGAGNKLATSTDGTNWTTKTIDGAWRGIAYGNGVWVVVGNGIATSTDNGATWTTRILGTDNWVGGLNAVAYGNGRFVAVGAARNGSGNDIVTSTDGIRWVTQTNVDMRWITQTNVDVRWWERTQSDYWQDVAYGNGRWVAVSRHGIIATSTDGFNWRGEIISGGEKINLFSVTYEDGAWVIIEYRYDEKQLIFYFATLTDKAIRVSGVNSSYVGVVNASDIVNERVFNKIKWGVFRFHKAHGNGRWVSVHDPINYHPYHRYCRDGYNIATSLGQDYNGWTKQTVGSSELHEVHETMYGKGNGRYINKNDNINKALMAIYGIKHKTLK
jgi:hypothetical protein